MSKQNKPTTGNLYLQVWRDPIYDDLLFTHVNAQQWQTLTALAVFINNKGECYPSLSKLKQILGLRSVASVSRRILSLEKVLFKGVPLITVSRKNKKVKQGKLIYSNNTYRINQQIITIFAPPAGFEPATLILTGFCSTIELQGIIKCNLELII